MVHICDVRLSYNPYFSACFFSQNIIFLSQQISRNSVPACFFSEANGAVRCPLLLCLLKTAISRHVLSPFLFVCRISFILSQTVVSLTINSIKII